MTDESDEQPKTSTELAHGAWEKMRAVSVWRNGQGNVINVHVHPYRGMREFVVDLKAELKVAGHGESGD